MDPLPGTLDEFRSKEYWDSFFRRRDKEPFEWYSEWPELKDLLLSNLAPEDDALVVGCGNSELSAELYDSGRHKISNVDFSKVCIIEMLKKNVRTRPKMRWLVMDITNLQFSNGSFDVVVDKGALDALTGEPGEEGSEAGAKLLAEVSRVLRPKGGRYLCITLAQEHVLDLFLNAFQEGWLITISEIPAPKKGKSPFKSYFVLAKSIQNEAEVDQDRSAPIELKFQPDTTSEAYEHQTKPLLAAVERANQARSTKPKAGQTRSTAESADQDLDRLHPGRWLGCQLALSDEKLGPRYSARVLDAPQGMKLEVNCAVFLVPQGREHEWLFASEEGNWDLVKSAAAARLIVVTLNRGHVFGSAQEVQDELSGLVKPLLPKPSRTPSSQVPFMTTSDGIGKRTIHEEVDSPLTGKMSIEDVELNTQKGTTYRRLVFARNPNLVQSEAAVIKPKKGKKGAKLAPYGLDHSHLASDYHAAFVAGLAMVAPELEEKVAKGGVGRALVVGLGGGLFPMFLRLHLPFSVEVVELDAVVAQVAERHFGFNEDERLKVTIDDGIAVVASAAARCQGSADTASAVAEGVAAIELSGKQARGGPLDVIFVDADSGDASLPMSCPPPAFLERQFLDSARASLSPKGLLAMNVVARATAPYAAAVKALYNVFEEVYEVSIEGDVNRVLLGMKEKLPATTSLVKRAATIMKLGERESQWRRGPNLVEVIKNAKRLKHIGAK